MDLSGAEEKKPKNPQQTPRQREKELALRLRRRSSARTSFSAASLTAFAARRFSAAATMRSGARLPGMSETKKGGERERTILGICPTRWSFLPLGLEF